MSEENKPKPLYRVSFARIIGTDEHGDDMLGSAREIGAIWERRDPAKGGIQKFDHFPLELSKREGVVFITPVK